MTTATPAAPTPNAPLLTETLTHITLFPEEWNQNEWRCGVTACFAGHAAILHGAKWALPDYFDMTQLTQLTQLIPDGAIRMYFGEQDDTDRVIARSDVTYLNADGVRVYEEIQSYARWALGLTQHMAGELFASDNSLRDLTRIVTALTTASQTEDQ